MDPGGNKRGSLATKPSVNCGVTDAPGFIRTKSCQASLVREARNPARVLEELAQRDRAPCGGLIRQDRRDRAVERQAPVVDELERDGAAERLPVTGGPQVIVAVDRSAAFEVAHTRPQVVDPPVPLYQRRRSRRSLSEPHQLVELPIQLVQPLPGMGIGRAGEREQKGQEGHVAEGLWRVREAAHEGRSGVARTRRSLDKTRRSRA